MRHQEDCSMFLSNEEIKQCKEKAEKENIKGTAAEWLILYTRNVFDAIIQKFGYKNSELCSSK